MLMEAALASVRFGLGAQPGEMARAAADPQAWLRAQINPTAAHLGTRAAQALPTSNDAITALVKRRKDMKAGGDEALRRAARRSLVQEISARNQHAQRTQTPFAERWAQFWANHFTVAATRIETVYLAGPFEREAIRPHVFGRFETLLKAATLHAGMLSYLDNHRSFGPSTRVAQRRGLGLNENLAREVLELHTLGVDGGYTQTDVESLAKALTGYVPGFSPAARRDPGKPVVFAEFVHEPGAKTLMRQRFRADGQGQAPAMLDFLSQHPSTANHISRKLARHFIADMPPRSAVDALTHTFNRTRGDLGAIAQQLIELEEAWALPLVKVKTPQELMISAARILGLSSAFGGARKSYAGFAQTPLLAPSPAGWADTADVWLSPDAMMKRVEWANQVARRSRMPANVFLTEALGPLASAADHSTLRRAESPAQAMTLALMSPAFQRR